MNAFDIVRSVAKYRKVNMTELAKRMKVSRAALYMRLGREGDHNMRTDTFVNMLAEMGFSVIVMPTNTIERLYEHEYLLTATKVEEKKNDKH